MATSANQAAFAAMIGPNHVHRNMATTAVSPGHGLDELVSDVSADLQRAGGRR